MILWHIIQKHKDNSYQLGRSSGQWKIYSYYYCFYNDYMINQILMEMYTANIITQK